MGRNRRQVKEKMVAILTLLIDAALIISIWCTLSGMTEVQDEHDEDIDNHDDRLNALEDYADYIREEIMSLKRKENADDDRADNYVRWRRRVRRAEESD